MDSDWLVLGDGFVLETVSVLGGAVVVCLEVECEEVKDVGRDRRGADWVIGFGFGVEMACSGGCLGTPFLELLSRLGLRGSTRDACRLVDTLCSRGRLREKGIGVGSSSPCRYS